MNSYYYALSNRSISKIIIYKLVSTLLPVIPILLLLNHPSLAQTQTSHTSLGNLGVPSSSERFFGAGRENVEREVRHLQEQPTSSEQLLDTSQAAQIRQVLLRFEDSHMSAEEIRSSQVEQPYNSPEKQDKTMV
jgi:hypothetical protein